MKQLLPDLVAKEQAAFVPKRSISHHCLLAQEMMNKFQFSTDSKGFMALKVDMEQAYDRMSWETLQLVLAKCGFPQIFGKWVTECISYPSFALLINGKRSDWIEGQCGFRQGCPLSPYLFILCSELLSLALHQRGNELGVPITIGGTRISHLLYADDILIFSQANSLAAKNIKSILKDYCAWTGQKVNEAKSAMLFSKRTPGWKCRRLAKYLGYSRAQELSYLGIKLATRKLWSADFAEMAQKIRNRTNDWGNRFLSLAGRVTLINTVLLAMPAYALSHTDVPKGTSALIEKACRNFLWNKSSTQRGMHYINWNELCKPSRYGGLGFHSPAHWKGPLRARITWDFLTNPGTPLNICLKEKYGSNCWNRTAKRGDSKCWAIITDGARSLTAVVKWMVVDGKSISALNQIWILDRALAKWPTFMDIIGLEQLTVADLLTVDRNWNIPVLQQFFGLELVKLITGIPIKLGPMQDYIELLKAPWGKSITAISYDSCFPLEPDFNLWYRKLKLHPREQIFWWRLLHDALPTYAWLMKRGLTSSAECPWGCREIEDYKHIATSCLCTKGVLNVFDRWGFRLPRFQCFQEFINFARASNRNSMAQIRIICYAVYQCWKARNAKIHGKTHGTPVTMASYIIGALTKTEAYPFLEHWDANQPSRLFQNYFWHPPPPGWIKANVDGALLPSNCAGVGVTIRDDRGEFILAAGKNLLHWDSNQVEMEAILFISRLIEPWMLEFQGIIIEGDNSVVIDLLRSSMKNAFWSNKPTVGPDIAFLRQFHQVLFHYVPRECNKAADFCASFALHEPFVWKYRNSENFAFFDLLDEDRRLFSRF